MLMRRVTAGKLSALVGVIASTAALATQVNVARAASAVPGLPPAPAAAALVPEPSLPVPHGWPFSDAFSRTSGTGRLIGGALEWSDWVDDAYGASSPEGAPLNSITASSSNVAQAQGGYVYPAGAADNDGADIFRAAAGLTRSASVWRVDWNTLADPSIPIAEWTFDTDDSSRTGASAWPAGANVSSSGIEKALVVSAKEARLVDAISGQTVARFPTDVDRNAQSFVVSIPRSVMPVDGRWRVRLGAGLADATGTGFAVPSLSGGVHASDTAPRIYNMTFRKAAQEPAVFTDGSSDADVARLGAELQGVPTLGDWGAGGATSLVTGNFWGEDDQADTLAAGDVSKFSQVVDWSSLAARRTTKPPLVKGWSDRWYVTDLRLGQGMDDSSSANPAFLQRVQPYAVYIPTTYNGRKALPFTWILHSLNSNYNQYGAVNPRQVKEECEDRNSICASPEGFGPAGSWAGVAQHDFWQVWRQVALGLRIAPNRTVISGYSMGGLGSFGIGNTYPDDFSEALALDGSSDSACSGVDRAANARWVPFVISNALVDELSPHQAAVGLAAEYAAAGDRFTLFSTSMPEHLVTAGADGFSAQIAALHDTPKATANPGTIDYSWCANVVDPALGLGPSGLYWLADLKQRTASLGSSRVVANDGAIPEPTVSERLSASVVDPPDAPPMQVTTGSWQTGAAPTPTRTLTLDLTNVASLAVDVSKARLPHGVATVTTDGPATLTLGALAPGTTVRGPDGSSDADSNGTAHVQLASGASTVIW